MSLSEERRRELGQERVPLRVSAEMAEQLRTAARQGRYDETASLTRITRLLLEEVLSIFGSEEYARKLRAAASKRFGATRAWSLARIVRDALDAFIQDAGVGDE